MPQFRPIQQSLFPELSGAFRESESFATLNQEARHDSHRHIEHHSRQAYPSANVLAVTERDFDSPLSRKRLFSRVATNE